MGHALNKQSRRKYTYNAHGAARSAAVQRGGGHKVEKRSPRNFCGGFERSPASGCTTHRSSTKLYGKEIPFQCAARKLLGLFLQQ